MTAVARERPKRFPILDGILPLDTGRIPAEAVAGATLAALAIPETMGYASMAQMPIITGLYTLLIPVLLFAIFGSSRHLVVAADSATAITIAAGLTGLGLVGGTPEWIAMMGLAALLVAVVLLIARVLKLGFLAYFLSRSVLVGSSPASVSRLRWASSRASSASRRHPAEPSSHSSGRSGRSPRPTWRRSRSRSRSGS